MTERSVFAESTRDVDLAALAAMGVLAVARVSFTVRDLLLAASPNGGGVIGFEFAYGGVDYVEGDELSLPVGSGCSLVVSTVDENGSILTGYLLTCGDGFSVASDVEASGGTGTGATVNITEVGGRRLIVVPAAGADTTVVVVSAAGRSNPDGIGVTPNSTSDFEQFYYAADTEHTLQPLLYNSNAWALLETDGKLGMDAGPGTNGATFDTVDADMTVNTPIVWGKGSFANDNTLPLDTVVVKFSVLHHVLDSGF